MNNQLLDRPVNRPQAVNAPTTAQARYTPETAPAVFRRQERFWKEVKNRITERNPAVRDVFERLY